MKQCIILFFAGIIGLIIILDHQANEYVYRKTREKLDEDINGFLREIEVLEECLLFNGLILNIIK